MELTIFDGAGKEGSISLLKDAQSLYKAFEWVKDGRKQRGKRYPLPLLLTLLLFGKCVGETTIHGIVGWIKEREEEMRQYLDWPKRFPTNSTYTEALAKCDGQEVAQALAQVILKARGEERCGSEPSRLYAQKEEEPLTHVAMDGKTMRGTLSHASGEQPSVHLLAFYECQSGIVLSQRAVKSKENEIVAAKALSHPTLVKGSIVSTDAMHTQKSWCANMDAYGGYYLTLVKENHPTTYQDLEYFFEEKDAKPQEWDYHKEIGKGHGRLEKREIWASTQMNEWFELQWAGIAQVFRIRRSLQEGEKKREEVVYGITNLPKKKASAARLLSLQRAHWLIEIV